MSAAAARIAQEALKADVTVAALAKMALADAAFALKLMALVNSPAFTRSHKVTDINQAAALLGIRGLRTVALSLIVSGLCPAHESCGVLMANSLRRAVACRLVAAELAYQDLDACFATGLFLDSGLLCRAHSDRDLALAIAATPPHHRVLRERAEGVAPHPVLGSALAQKYFLPQETVGAIESHHADNMPEGALAEIAWLGEHVAAVFESPDVDRAHATVIAHAQAIGLDTASVVRILQSVPAHVAELANALGSDVGELRDLDALRSDAGRLLCDINGQYECVIRKLSELLADKDVLTENLRRANEAMATLAFTDALTGLPNRRALEDALMRATSRASREGTWLSLVALDVDHFKRLNDDHGHAAGDAVLGTVGKVLNAQCRKSDVAARYGGEEFTLVLANTNALGATIVAERIRRAFEASETVHEGKMLKVTVSLGVASAQGGSAALLGALAARADEALYAAKRTGRNRVVRL